MSELQVEKQRVRWWSRYWIKKIVRHPLFSNTVIVMILLNAILVGLETYPQIANKHHTLFYIMDQCILAVFTIELGLRLLSEKPFYRFFQDPWNVFDFFLVVSGYVFVSAHFMTVFRVLRIIRVLRAISTIPSLRRLVEALILTIPTLGNISLLLGLFFYIFAVTGTILFANASPEYFGSLHQSFLTLFQMVTLEAWASDIMRPLLEKVPWAWIYFVLFIMMGTFVILNLFVGIIVNKVENIEDTKVDDLYREVHLLRLEIAELKKLIHQAKE
ncbi:voltage-gated sodium channel [Planifilum fimeticola]|uniref:Voltage-gated sodium channel n=1 Tax=Planifilum fimeticola TaxID=201975 RepID=A0A2T0LDZ8_9BACL|nr:ion transporter [Planifilum fimeticola]PRX40325.1 voltage-gated sodium channel [Planifilum fimeticola]